MRDETFLEAYAKLPLAKRIDLWKNCDGRPGGLRSPFAAAPELAEQV